MADDPLKNFNLNNYLSPTQPVAPRPAAGPAPQQPAVTPPAPQATSAPVSPSSASPAATPPAAPGPSSSSIDWASYYLDPASYEPLRQFISDATVNRQPARPGPQSWRDWATKNYSPSLGDIANIYGDAWTYGARPLAAQGLQAAGAWSPGGSAQAEQTRIQNARNAAGPWAVPIDVAGIATQPLTYAGVGPISGLAAKAVPRAIAEAAPLVPAMVRGGTGASLISGVRGAGQGGSGEDIAKNAAISAAKGFPLGAAIGGVTGSPEVTLGDIAGKATEAQQAASENLANVRVPWRDVGVQVEGQQNPSLQDLLNQKAWASTLKQGEDPAGAIPRLQAGINRVFAQEPAKSAIGEADTAAQRAQNAQMLQRWSNEVGLPGVDVQGEAVQAMSRYPVNSPEYNALREIASVKPGEPSRLAEGLRKIVPTAMTGAGEYASAKMGVPFAGTLAQGIASNVVDPFLQGMARPKGVSPLIQQEIARQSQPLTGYAASSGDSAAALRNILTWAALSGMR